MTDITSLLQLNEHKLENIERQLEKNWFFQIILVVLSLCLIFEKNNVLREIVKVYNDKIDINTLSILFPMILFYTFIRFGYLLSSFLTQRKINECLWNEFIGSRDCLKEGIISTSRPSFFEAHHLLSNNIERKKIPFVIYIYFSIIILSLNHSLTMVMSGIYIGNKIGLVLFYLFYLGILSLCYWQFYLSKKEYLCTKLYMICNPILSLFLTIFFISVL